MDIQESFDWKQYLAKPDFRAVPVSCFKHVAFSGCWHNITAAPFVEVKSPDCTSCSTPCAYWIAVVINVKGYLVLLRYEGVDKSIWINLCTEPHIHPIGWCAENGMPICPPKCIQDKYFNWQKYFVRRLSNVRTIPPDLTSTFKQHTSSLTLKKGLKLEVLDKNLLSAVRVGTVCDMVGGRVHVRYDQENEDGIWCSSNSDHIHPIGWAQIVGHPLRGTAEYAIESLMKTLYQTHAINEAKWEMFPPMPRLPSKSKFQANMKLEVIDPLNLSKICVSTVKEVLRNNYLMIGIDGIIDPDGTESFCYHASSPCIFPAGFCDANGLELTPPEGHEGQFVWDEYIKITQSELAPAILFHRF